jgi:chaperone modulatory protein CbpM
MAETVEIVETLTVAEICRGCDAPAEWVAELVAHGILDPEDGAAPRWRFRAVALRRARRARALQRDLGLNLAGVALALDLIEERDRLRARLRALGAGG